MEWRVKPPKFVQTTTGTQTGGSNPRSCRPKCQKPALISNFSKCRQVLCILWNCFIYTHLQILSHPSFPLLLLNAGRTLVQWLFTRLINSSFRSSFCVLQQSRRVLVPRKSPLMKSNEIQSRPPSYETCIFRENEALIPPIRIATKNGASKKRRNPSLS